MKKLSLSVTVLCIVAAIFASWAHADEPYPTRPITTIVPFAAGGGTDGAARVFADVIAKRLGQPFVVVNKPGASGTVGASALAKSKPDGYTCGHLASTATLAECFTRQFTADYTSDDFVPVAQWSGYPPSIICKTDKPFKTFKELLDHARKTDQTLFGSQGKGIASELAMMIVEQKEGLKKFKYVPFKGDSEIISAVLGNHVDVGCVTFAVAVPLVKAGQIRVLTIIPDNKMPDFPDVPNLYELGYDTGFRQFYLATFAPKGTPPGIVKKLEKAIEETTQDGAFKSRMNNMNMPIIYKPSEQLGALVQEMKRTYFDLAKKGMF